VIFFARVCDVTFSTIRTIFMTRGEKIIASIIGFFEVTIWILVAARVINDVGNDPWKILAYSAGFATGCFVGVTVEEFLAVGLITIRAIVSFEDGEEVARVLREKGFGVTIFEGKGMEKKKSMLLVYTKRKRRKEAINVIKDKVPSAVISFENTKVESGFGLKK